MRARISGWFAAVGVIVAIAGCGGGSKGTTTGFALVGALFQPPTAAGTTATLVTSPLPTGTDPAPVIGVTNSGIAPIGGNIIIEVQYTSNGAGIQDIFIGTPGGPQYYDISNIPASPAGNTVTLNVPVNLQFTAPGGNFPVSVEVSQGGQVSQPGSFVLGVSTTR